MMLIILLFVATILIIVWIVLQTMATQEDWLIAAYNKVLDNRFEITKLKLQDQEKAEKLSKYHGLSEKVMRVVLGANHQKNIKKLEEKNASIQQGDFSSVGILDIPGYVFLRKSKSLSKGNLHNTILKKCSELYGKKYAENKAKQLIARLVSYAIAGVAVTFLVGVIVYGAGSKTGGLGVIIIGTLLVLVLDYAQYDEVGDQISKRREAITRQFPNVVSKLALLVTSGMIMDRAWRETAESQELELYQEMKKTSDELQNLIEPNVAYTNFIDRCNTKETTKLASAIIQNQSKGNAEIGRLLKDMANEAWMERRHTAKRDSEKANSKLMIPTMLLFLTVMIIIMVPIIINFTNL